MISVDLNCDLGESFGAYKIGLDEQVIPYITSANVACGFHAGDPKVMAKTVAMCRQYGVQVGAHPGYPDLQGFGRRNMQVSPEDAKYDVMYQVGALKAFCDSEGIALHHVKPHGALYNMAGKDYRLALAICEGIKAIDPNLKIMGLYGSCMIQAAKDISLPYINEVFADRGYQADGSLVPRTQPGAMIEDEEIAIKRVIRMVKEGKVTAVTGEDIAISADSICVHGDGPKALEFVKRIRKELSEAGVVLEAK